MSLCCFGVCCKKKTKKEKNKFIELSEYFRDFAINEHLYTPPKCPCRRLAYDVQWRHLCAKSELLEFKIQPHDIYSGVIQEVEKLTDDTEVKEQDSKTLAVEGNTQRDDGLDKPDEPQSPSTSSRDTGSTKQTEGYINQKSKNGNEMATTVKPDVAISKDTEESTNEATNLLTETRDSSSKKIQDEKDSSEIIEVLQSEKEPLKKETKEEKKESRIRRIVNNWKKMVHTKTEKADELELDTDDAKRATGKFGQIELVKYRETGEKSMQRYKPKPRDLSLFKTEYTNTSGHDQKFTFHTERKTTSTMSINVQKSYTVGGQLNLALSLPVTATNLIDPLSVTGALTGQYQLTKSKNESITTEQMWSVNNDVTVQDKKKVTAEMRVTEEEAFATFKVKHTITPMPNTSNIPVYVVPESDIMKDPDDRKILDVFTLKNKNLARIFDNEKARQNGIKACRETKSIEFVSEGDVKCVYQSKQMIDVKTVDVTRPGNNGEGNEGGLVQEGEGSNNTGGPIQGDEVSNNGE